MVSFSFQHPAIYSIRQASHKPMRSRVFQGSCLAHILLPGKAFRSPAINNLIVRAGQRLYSSADKDAALDLLRASFQYEASAGLTNVQGKELPFAEFVTAKLEELLAQSLSNEEKIQLNACLSGFRRYDSMKLEDRQKHLNKANWHLGGKRLNIRPSFQSSRTQAAPARDEAALQERFESNRRASTSQPGGTMQGAHLTTGSEGNGTNGQQARRDTGNVTQNPAGRSLGSSRNGLGADFSGTASGISPESLPLSAEIEAASVESSSSLASPEDPSAKKADKERQRLLRISFDESAKLFAQQRSDRSLTQQGGLTNNSQGSAAWFAMREGRLTASAFGNALGFWPNGRAELWEEKIGLRPRFQGNEATAWGTRREPEAAERYKEVTGHALESMNFMIYGDSLVTGFLGASPDGLIPMGPAASGLAGSKAASAFGKAPQGTGPGLLEIKCPFNKGQPEKATPYARAPYYYMPQVQGLMEIFDREWCNLFSYTVNSAALYHIRRDRGYWRDAYGVLAEFWWQSVLPAKHVREIDASSSVELYRPSKKHLLTDQLIERSKSMAESAMTTMYPPSR